MVLIPDDFQQPFYGETQVNLDWGFRVGDSDDPDYVKKFSDPDLRHRGTDYNVSLFDPVLTVANGEVVEVHEATKKDLNKGFGSYVVVKHTLEDGYTLEDGSVVYVVYSLYAHLFSIEVKEEDEVEIGDLIGSVGETGNITGPHLHFEISSSPDVWKYGGYDIPDDEDGGFVKTDENSSDSTSSFVEGNSFDPVEFIKKYGGSSVIVPLPEDDVESIQDLTPQQSSSGEVSVVGELEIYGDKDAFAVYLEAGELYQISVKGTEANGSPPLGDAYFSIRFGDFENIVFTSSDSGKDEIASFSPEESGLYYINIGGGGSLNANPLKPHDYFGIQYGGYELSVDNLGAPPEPSLPEKAPGIIQGPQTFASNPGFETGDLSGWNVLGNATAETGFDADGEDSPNGDGGLTTATEGDYFAVLQSGGSATTSEIEAFLGLDSGELASISNGTPITGTAIMIEVDAIRATAFDFDFYFDAGDYEPYNDFAFMVIDGELIAFGDVGDVGDYGESGWLDSTWFEAGVTELDKGTHEIGFGILDVGDEFLSSALYLDDFQFV